MRLSLVLDALHKGALPLLLLALGLAGFVLACQPDAGMPLQDVVICVSDWQPYTSVATLFLYKPCVHFIGQHCGLWTQPAPSAESAWRPYALSALLAVTDTAGSTCFSTSLLRFLEAYCVE
jgi:hypothetical protein